MTSLFHTLHIGTLATWLSVAGFGTVAVMVPDLPVSSSPRPQVEETQWIPRISPWVGKPRPKLRSRC